MSLPIIQLLDTLTQSISDYRASVLAQETTQAARLAAETADAAAITDLQGKLGVMNNAWAAVLGGEPTVAPAPAGPPLVKFGK